MVHADELDDGDFLAIQSPWEAVESFHDEASSSTTTI